ncbi:MAG: CDP-alcohol phosphatidyltransferase family protein [Candidatus Poseidoniaceae archaeon]|jgi:phosphatidylserine synthase|nr:CDP-alcohol phosphatidyltransferase family protein [Candidatus Poseidoniaceae archaeon]
MKTTFRMMGLADYITICNGLLGVMAIVFILLAVDDMSEPYYQGGLLTDYIWWAMLCILLSAFGDIIDGPIARRWSKQQILGGSLDIMSDCVSFCVAPAIMIFAMFGRMGEATPLWTFMLAVSCFWIIACGMLRLSRFQHEKGGDVNYFNGLSTPASAMLLLSAAGLIWLQPSSGIGPEISSWECNICWGSGKDKPYFDFILLPLMFFCGAMMISDRKMSKLKSRMLLRLSMIQFISILFGIIHALTLTHSKDAAEDLSGTSFTIFLFTVSFVMTFLYIVGGPKFVDIENTLQMED